MNEFEQDERLPEEIDETVEAAEEVTEAAEEIDEAAEVAEETEEPAETTDEIDESDDAAEEAEEPAEAAEESEEPAEEAEEIDEDAETAEEADELAAVPAAAASMEDALVQELEGIRDLLQQELDGAQSGELIQELDEMPEETEEPQEEEIPEEERCLCCGERRRNTERGEDYPYCEECRELMKAQPLKASSVMMLVLMFAAAIASLFFCANSLNTYSSLMEADQHYAKKELNQARDGYYAYVQQSMYDDDISMAAVKKLAGIFADQGYLGDANDLVTQFFSETALKLPWNKKYAAMAAEYEKLYTASNTVRDLLQDVLYGTGGEDIDYDAKDAELQKLLEEEDEAKKVEPIYVEYYRFVLMNLAGKSPETQLEQLYRVEEMDDGSHMWLYLSNILSTAARCGDLETTKKYYEKTIAVNVEETSAYTAMANVYRFQKTPDPEAIRAVAAEAEAKLPDGSIPVWLQMNAIADLLQNKPKDAAKNIKAYLDSGEETGQTPYTVQSCNLYALIAVITEDKDAYAEMEDVLGSAGLTVSPLVEQYKAGKLTIEQVLTDNGGDF